MKKVLYAVLVALFVLPAIAQAHHFREVVIVNNTPSVFGLGSYNGGCVGATGYVGGYGSVGFAGGYGSAGFAGGYGSAGFAGGYGSVGFAGGYSGGFYGSNELLSVGSRRTEIFGVGPQVNIRVNARPAFVREKIVIRR